MRTRLQGLVAYRIGGEFLAPDGESFFALDSRVETGQEGAVLNIEFATGFPEIDAAVLVDFAGFRIALDLELDFGIPSGGRGTAPGDTEFLRVSRAFLEGLADLLKESGVQAGADVFFLQEELDGFSGGPREAQDREVEKAGFKGIRFQGQWTPDAQHLVVHEEVAVFPGFEAAVLVQDDPGAFFEAPGRAFRRW